MKLNKRYLWLIFLLILVVLPLWFSLPWVHTFSMILLFIFWATAWNIIGGMAGEINFFHPLFIGAGAYTSTLLFLNYGISPWIGMWVGVLMAIFIAILCGWICYRARLPHLPFALAALGFTYLGFFIASGLEVTNGTRGVVLQPKADPLNMVFATKASYYYMALIMAATGVGLSFWISRCRLGYYLAAIKGNLLAAEAIGINTIGYRLIAMGISAGLCAVGGTFYVQLNLYVDPHTAVSISTVISMILFCAIGGFGTVWGPAVGTILLMPIGELLRLYTIPGVDRVIYGFVVILVIIFVPNGLVPWFQDFLNKKQISV